MSAAKAVAVLRGDGVTGLVRFHQPHGALDAGTRVYGRVAGLPPGARRGLRVLLFGDESGGEGMGGSGGFKALGAVYNPFSKPHGEWRVPCWPRTY